MLITKKRLKKLESDLFILECEKMDLKKWLLH